MTADQLRRVGEALYGANSWKTPMAENIGVSNRQIVRYMSGENAISAGVAARVMAFAEDRLLKSCEVIAEIQGELG